MRAKAKEFGQKMQPSNVIRRTVGAIRPFVRIQGLEPGVRGHLGSRGASDPCLDPALTQSLSGRLARWAESKRDAQGM